MGEEDREGTPRIGRGIMTVLDILANVENAGSAMMSNGFDQAELVSILVKHCRDVDPKVSMAATSKLLEYLEKVAENSGYMVTASREIMDETGTTRISATKVATKLEALEREALAFEKGSSNAEDDPEDGEVRGFLEAHVYRRGTLHDEPAPARSGAEDEGRVEAVGPLEEDGHEGSGQADGRSPDGAGRPESGG